MSINAYARRLWRISQQLQHCRSSAHGFFGIVTTLLAFRQWQPARHSAHSRSNLLYSGAWTVSGLRGATTTSPAPKIPPAPAFPAAAQRLAGIGRRTTRDCVFCNMIAAVDYAIAQGMPRRRCGEGCPFIGPRALLLSLPQCLPLRHRTHSDRPLQPSRLARRPAGGGCHRDDGARPAGRVRPAALSTGRPE